jgi:hypothetical protein
MSANDQVAAFLARRQAAGETPAASTASKYPSANEQVGLMLLPDVWHDDSLFQVQRYLASKSGVAKTTPSATPSKLSASATLHLVSGSLLVALSPVLSKRFGVSLSLAPQNQSSVCLS